MDRRACAGGGSEGSPPSGRRRLGSGFETDGEVSELGWGVGGLGKLFTMMNEVGQERVRVWIAEGRCDPSNRSDVGYTASEDWAGD